MKKQFYLIAVVIVMTVSMYAETTSGWENAHEAVDLGLSVKWATCNVGANRPEEYGDYYAWGETTPKRDYSWATYKYAKGTKGTLTKYNYKSIYGRVDNKRQLESSDDVAHVNWGGKWRMPTLDEEQELLYNCTWTWTTRNGVKGYNVKGPNGNSIFLPAAGSFPIQFDFRVGSGGDYWSSTLDHTPPALRL